jgi:hypothetical protein
MCFVFTFFILFGIVASICIPEANYQILILASIVGVLLTVKGALSHYKKQVKIDNILKELSLLRGTTHEEEKFIWNNSRTQDLDLLETKLNNLKKK